MAALRSSSSCTSFFSLKQVERPVDHAHRALDDLLAGGDDRLGLLAAEHGLGDLGRVGEMREARLVDLDAGLGQALLELLL